MKSCKFAFFVTWLLAILFQSLGGTAQAAKYDGPTTYLNIVTNNGVGDPNPPAGQPPLDNFPHDTRLWIPDDVAVIRGVIVGWNGVYGDARGIVDDAQLQAFARTHGFGLLGTHYYVGTGRFEGVKIEAQTLLKDLEHYAGASGHPEIANLPMISGGFSASGQGAYGLNATIPERMITFHTNKGGMYVSGVLSENALKAPSIGVGDVDDTRGLTAIMNNFNNSRPRGARWSVAIEKRTAAEIASGTVSAHRTGNIFGMWYAFMDHAIRMRYPAGATPLNGPVALLDLPVESGWLATKPTSAEGLIGKAYPYADYTGDKTTACWLMDEGIANLYRGFATYGPVATHGPAVTVTVMNGPIFNAGTSITFKVEVDSTLFPDWVSADLYDGADKLGTVTNGGTNTISAVRPWGGRGVTAIARNAAQNERTSTPKHFIVRNAVTLANTAATMAQRTSANLNATFSPAWGSHTVTAYWGTVNGGSNATNWQHSAVVGTFAGGDATNVTCTATGLTEATDYYFTFSATGTGSPVWAGNVMNFKTVTPQAPTSSGAALTALEDTPTALAAGNFGYTDPLSVALAAVQITSLPVLGTLKNGGVTMVNGNLPLTVTAANIGSLSYQSATNGNGTPYTTMGIKVMNAGGLWSTGAPMTLNVTPVNDKPTSTGGSVNLNGNTIRTFSAGDFRFADVDAGDTLGAIQVISLPATGTLKLNGTAINTVPSADIPLVNIGTLTYTAGPGYTVSDSFTFKVRDTSNALSESGATMAITGSSTFAVLTATNPTNSTTDYLTNTTGTISNIVTAPLLNSLTIDTTVGSNTWNLAGRTATITTGSLIMTGPTSSLIESGTLKSGSSGLIVTQNGTSILTLNAVIANNGSTPATLTKAGTGPLTLAAANTFTGATTISGGTLTLTNTKALEHSPLDTANSVPGGSTAGLKTTLTTLTLGGLTGNRDLATVFTTALGGSGNTTSLGGYSGLTALTLNPGPGFNNSYAGMVSNGTPSMALFKTGLGTQTLSGTNSLTHATVTDGTLGITGGSLKLANGFVNVGSAAAPSIVKIDGGNLDVNSPGNNSGGLQVGHLKGTLGAIYLNSGSISSSINGYNLHVGGLGRYNPSYGFMSITGGEISGRLHRTRIGQYSGTGVWYQSGGSYSNANYSGTIEIGGVADPADSNIGVVYLNNTAQFTSISAVNVATNATGTSIGTLTVAGSAALVINNTLEVAAVSNTTTTGTVNLNGGTLTVRTIKNNATGTCNFNGGTLKSDQTGTLLSGTGTAYVYPVGLTVDTNGKDVTIPQVLQGPSGSGVATIPVPTQSQGSGYIGAPYVSLVGNGTGATAVANMVDDGTGKNTYKVGSITVTCPGRGYSSLTRASLSGGLPSGGVAAILDFAKATFAPNTGGGLRKTGTGKLTLADNNTYTGDTTVQAGVLAINDKSIANSGKLVISGGKVDLTRNITVKSLYFGTTQQGPGTYTASSHSTYFTGSGTLTVPQGSNAPTSTGASLSVAKNTVKTFAASDFPFADVNAGDTLGAIKLTSLPANGTLKRNGAAVTLNAEVLVTEISTLTYTPKADFNGLDSFKFQVRDAVLFSSDATMNISVVTQIVVQNGDFEFPTPHKPHNGTDADWTNGTWAYVGTPWTASTTQYGRLSNAPMVGTAKPGNWIFNLNDSNSWINQNLNATVSVGDTLSVTFYVMSDSSPGQINATFKVGSTDYTETINNPATGAPVPYTLTKTVGVSGNLNLRFSKVSGRVWIDNISNVTVTPAVAPQSRTSRGVTKLAAVQTLDQDQDHDGVPNGIERFLGGNVQTTDSSALPGVNKAADGKLSVTWTKSVDFTGDYGTDYVIQTADTPAGTWDDVPVTGGAVTVSGNDVIYTFPTPGSASKFVRLKVMGAP